MLNSWFLAVTVSNENYPNSKIAKINICEDMPSDNVAIIDISRCYNSIKIGEVQFKIHKLTFPGANFSFGLILLLY